MSDYIPDLTERYPEGFRSYCGEIPEELEDDIPFEGNEANWYTVSYYTWGGSQEGATVYVPDGEEPSRYIHRYLVEHLGEDYGEINDYMSFKEMMEA